MHGFVENKIYIQPLGILRGCVASEAVKAGHARLLAGGPLAFSMVRIIFREDRGQRHEKLHPVSGLEGYVAGLTTSQQETISGLLKNICGIRPALKAGNGRILSDWKHPLLQGIVNVTPDSFSDGGQYNRSDQAVAHARDLIRQGADIIDIGGESTRPGAEKITVEKELQRVIPVIEKLSDISVAISIDTRNAEVMDRALAAGATIVNDVSALSHDKAALDMVGKAGCLVILMHARNNPDTMQDDPRYDDVLLDVYDYLESRLEVCRTSGIMKDRIIIDPGIGFGKTVAHNMELMAGLSLFHGLGVPVLLGVSRKSFIGHITGEKEAGRRLAGSLAFAQAGYDQGVQILRVHDVLDSRQARDAWISL
ncbi:Dihydropteroate synthase [hydrothermal vent metagenome]|uniref:dihydropteroate synthase n=1 Tax=hydrothermal vent metagenome TaxID=652676 RepID=A0A3B0RDT9_9ZZZZ